MIDLKILLYLTADLSKVSDPARLTPEEKITMLSLLEKVCDYHAEC